MSFRLVFILGAALAMAAGTVAAQTDSLNAQVAFPAGWELSGGKGQRTAQGVLEVTGEGKDSNYWRSPNVPLQPGRLYRFEFRVRRVDGSGCVISGPDTANRDYYFSPGDWQWHGHVFRAPDSGHCYLRLGQWESTGTLQFDAVRLAPVVPLHRQAGELVLGEGESVHGRDYAFVGTFSHEGSHFHRTLQRATASFNSDRWSMGAGSELVYRFTLPKVRFSSAKAALNVNYHVKGSCVLEASRDGESWQRLAARDSVGDLQAELPADWFPAESVWLRVAGGEDASLQVNRVELHAACDREAGDGTGSTQYAEVTSLAPGLELASATLRSRGSGFGDSLVLTLKNPSAKSLRAALAGEVAGDGETASPIPPNACDVAAGGQAELAVDLPGSTPGKHRARLTVSADKDPAVRLTLNYTVADFYRADYGARIEGAGGAAAVWWCDATHKVPRQRAAPRAVEPAARMAAARNDGEALQIVVRPDRDLKGLTAHAGALTGPGGATIPAEAIEILRVYYHFVHTPTDETGVRDWWPDALPPLDAPLDVRQGENQPLWLLVHVPADAAAGGYTGTVTLQAEGWSARVPIALTVWDFALPERNHITTALGLSPGTIFDYHGLRTDADRRRVLDLYHRSFARHRISPYDPAPLDSIGVKFVPDADPPKAELDFSRFDAAMQRAVDEYHFNALRLPIDGMGGGTFHERVEPQIGDFTAGTPQYDAMFSSYLGQLESHLREKGWLDMAYVYWFDEPEPKDYDFVRAGMERLKKHGPGIPTMLTEEPVDALAGPIDIWCPVSFNYDREAARKRETAGDRFWWYVCCGPKAPYCTLFIDHPATELRVWLWQTWQRDVTGILVWETNYWTSSAAYPDAAQDPYADPMGYVSGYSTPRGVKAYWGNGDGRFIYPPLAASTPGKSGAEPVIAPPVSSIRWEMLREGIEDWEMLYRLRELLASRGGALPAGERERYQALLEVPASITSDMTTFATDPAAIYLRRAEIAQAIETLSAAQ